MIKMDLPGDLSFFFGKERAEKVILQKDNEFVTLKNESQNVILLAFQFLLACTRIRNIVLHIISQTGSFQ